MTREETQVWAQMFTKAAEACKQPRYRVVEVKMFSGAVNWYQIQRWVEPRWWRHTRNTGWQDVSLYSSREYAVYMAKVLSGEIESNTETQVWP